MDSFTVFISLRNSKSGFIRDFSLSSSLFKKPAVPSTVIMLAVTESGSIVSKILGVKPRLRKISLE